MTATYRSNNWSATDRSMISREVHPLGDAQSDDQHGCGMVRSRNREETPEDPGMPPETTASSRLADQMDRRRKALRLRWEAVADRAGISSTFLRKIRAGAGGASDVVIAGLEDALLWQRGSIAAIYRGAEPTPIADSPSRYASMTLGELLVERGLAQPEDLGASDDIRNDPVALEILDMSLPEDQISKMLKIYADMRRGIFEQVRGHNKRRQP